MANEELNRHPQTGANTWYSRISATHPGIHVPTRLWFLPSPTKFRYASYLLVSAAIAWLALPWLLESEQAIRLAGKPVVVHYIIIPILTIPYVLINIAAKKLQQRLFAVEALNDTRAPILLLRSFSADNPWLRRKPGRSQAEYMNDILGARLEEAISAALNSMGPLVAIGQPNERSTVVGAIRVYAGEENWISLVRELMRESQLIVLQFSPITIEGEEIRTRSSSVRLPDRIVYGLSVGFRIELRVLLEERLLDRSVLVSVDSDGRIVSEENFRLMIEQAPTAFQDAYPSSCWSFRLSEAIGSRPIGYGPNAERDRTDHEHVLEAFNEYVAAKTKGTPKVDA